MAMDLRLALTAAHVIGNLVWTGALLGAWQVASSRELPSKSAGLLARRLHKKLTIPAFFLVLAAGIARLTLDPDLYFHATHFMHVKLTLALVLIGLHHVAGARYRRQAEGTSETGALGPWFPYLVLGIAASSAYLAVVKPF